MTMIAGARRTVTFVALAAMVAMTIPLLGLGQAASAAIPVKEVAYGALPGQAAYVYESASAESPLVVLVHGGGFIGGSAQSRDVVSEATWLQDHGVTVVDVSYRLLSASGGSLASEVFDVEAAARWAKSYGWRYNGNSADLTLMGGSAGGTLVALAASAVHPRHVIDLSGINDMRTEVDGLVNDTRRTYAGALLEPALTTTLKCHVLSACSPVTEAQASPITSPDTATVWLIADSAKDVLVPPSQAVEMASAIAVHGGDLELHIVEGFGHGFELGRVLNRTMKKFVSS